MLKFFQQHLNLICPDWRERRFIIAFSGGLDSTALLRLMTMSLPPGQLAAAHLNHLIRPEAAAEQQFAAKTAEELGLHFIAENVDVPALAKSRRRGLEEAARAARYEFFQKAALFWSADFVATAHQADDQAETILMRLLKGCGGGGLAGIHPERPLQSGLDKNLKQADILRPLLPFTRAQLRSWLKEHSFSWVEDNSNNDGRYLRNAIRLNILPRLKKLNPKATEAIARASAIIRDEEKFWQLHLSALWPEMVEEQNIREGRLAIKREKFERLATAEKRRLLYEAFIKVRSLRAGLTEPVSLATIETVMAMLNKDRHKGLDLPGGLRAELNSDRLILSLASRLK